MVDALNGSLPPSLVTAPKGTRERIVVTPLLNYVTWGLGFHVCEMGDSPTLSKFHQ